MNDIREVSHYITANLIGLMLTVLALLALLAHLAHLGTPWHTLAHGPFWAFLIIFGHFWAYGDFLPFPRGVCVQKKRHI